MTAFTTQIAGLPALRWSVCVRPLCPECSNEMWLSVPEGDGAAEAWCEGCGHTFVSAVATPQAIGEAVVRALVAHTDSAEPGAAPDPARM